MRQRLLFVLLMACMGTMSSAFLRPHTTRIPGAGQLFSTDAKDENAARAPSILTSSLDVDNQALTSVIIFDVENSQQQDDLVEKIQNFVKIVREQPGFVSANLHKSLDGVKVANYAQWESKETFDAFRNNPSVQGCKEAKFLEEYGPPDSKTYEIFAWQTKDGTAPTIQSGPFVHFAEFDMLSTDLQPRMVELAKQHLGPAMELDGLLSATFHKSHDGAKVINYGQWENREAIEKLKTQPGFSTETTPYWDGVAINEHHLYELVSVTPPPSR